MRFKIAIAICAVGVALGRIYITPRLSSIPSIEGSFEALAHLFVGFLIIVPFYDREQRLGPSKVLGYLGWTLGLWELAWFLIEKLHS